MAKTNKPSHQRKYERRLGAEKEFSMDKIDRPKRPKSFLCFCGDPNCPNSRDDGVGANVGFTSDSPETPMAYPSNEIPARDLMRMMQEAKEMMSGRQYLVGGWDNARMQPSNQPPSSLSAAREKVAEYIIEVTDKLGWDEVIGNDEAKLALQETIEAATKHPDIYKFYEMVPPRGALLYGPPGCGKTMFAKATASAIARLSGKGKGEMILINGPAIQTKFVGETEEIIRNLFLYAKEYYKYHGHQLVLFFDEADSLFPDRSRSYRYEASQVAAFLAEMDGVGTDNSAFVLLASNRPETIDEACLRDGRCDRKIKIQRPSLEAIKHILLRTCHGKAYIANLNFDLIVDELLDPKHIVGDYQMVNVVTQEVRQGNINLAHILSGAMVVGLVAKAKSFAFRRDIENGRTSTLTIGDFLQAIMTLVEDNKGLPHTSAQQEIMEQIAKEKPEYKFNNSLN